MKTFVEIKNKISESITLKIAIIGFLILIMLIPAGMIKSLIMERQFTRNSVENEISDKWGKEQTISGPVLSVPYYIFKENPDKREGQKEMIRVNKTLYLLPDVLNINGELIPEIRYRGTYKVIVYKSQLNLNGEFIFPNAEDLNINPENIEWDKAIILAGISDLRGIQNSIEILWGNEKIAVEPGMGYTNIGSSGFTADVPLKSDQYSYPFEFNLELNGSKNLFFAPVGKTTHVNINSNWNNPSFSGDFLPDNREISDSCFTADWTVLHLNRNYPQIWDNQTYPVNHASFGVNLLFPVDEYQKSMRSAKYAIMFIALTFVIFLFVEILNKKRIHPVQYILVSFGLLIFYTLQLSLSEHIGFNLAYLISALAIISLITFYSHSIFKKLKLTIIMSSSLIVLYSFLFIILQLQDFSLLFGSIGLFIALGVIMYFSKRINWYGPIDDPKQLSTANN